MKIPTAINQIWISPDANQRLLPQELVDRCSLWQSLHPEFTYKLWNLEEIMSTFVAYQPALDAVSACRFPAMKADIARLVIIHERGGFHVDLKILPRRRFLNEFLDFSSVFVEHQPSPLLPDPLNFLTNSFFGAESGSPIIRTALEEAIEAVRCRKEGSVFHTTGPMLLTKALKFHVPHEGASRDTHVIRQNLVWTKYLDIGGAPYNTPGRHWSERQKTESLYEATKDVSRL